jgi:hypothetical protein
MRTWRSRTDWTMTARAKARKALPPLSFANGRRALAWLGPQPLSLAGVSSGQLFAIRCRAKALVVNDQRASRRGAFRRSSMPPFAAPPRPSSRLW